MRTILIVSFALSLVACADRSFDFDAATKDERQAWMDGQAKRLERTARYLLPSGGGPKALNFSLDGIETRPRQREMEMKIRVKVPYGHSLGVLPRDEIVQRLCNDYVDMALYEQEVRLITTMRKDQGAPVFRVTLSPHRCDTVLAQA